MGGHSPSEKEFEADLYLFKKKNDAVKLMQSRFNITQTTILCHALLLQHAGFVWIEEWWDQYHF